MKKSLLILNSLAATQGLLVAATLPFYEPFPLGYAEGERLGSGTSATVWDSGNGTGTGSPTNTSAAKLSYGGLITSSDSRGLLLFGTPSSNRDRGVAFSPAVTIDGSSPVLYASFLINVPGPQATSRRLAYFRNSTSSGNASAGIFLNGAGQLQISKGGDTPAVEVTNPLSPGTHLVVLRYRWVSASSGDDEVALWLDPASLSAEESLIPSPTLATTSGSDVAALNAFFVSQRTEASGTIWLDEVRVATTWAGVTPSDGSVPVTPQPYITQVFVGSDGLVLRGTNGPPNSGLSVLAASNAALGSEQWPVITTNRFDGAGDFDVTNSIPPGSTAWYYRVRADVSPSGPIAPGISVQPFDRTVVAGQDALFSITASGTPPLSYQWYFNTNAPLTGATSNLWRVVNAQLADQGTYHVVVTNIAGAVTSAVAVLTIGTLPPLGSPDGYATLNGGTTGGAAGPTVTVDNFTDFDFYVDNNSPYTVLVSGTINLGSSNVRVRDNKTIIGLGTNATLIGDLKVFGNNNVIIRNLTFSNPSGAGDNDGLTLQQCLNVWVDHCTFVDCADGNLDITHAADWVTVSWCHFYYTDPANTHRFSNLIGHSDSASAEAEDTGKLHVTFHHNWWGQLVHERMPRVRFGRVHLYNNYYHSPGNNNCIRAARDSEVLVENNYFDSVKNVWELYRTVGMDGKLFATNNLEVNTTWSAGSDTGSIQIPGTDILSSDANGLNPPPYAYTPEAASLVPSLVTNGAGVGQGPFAP